VWDFDQTILAIHSFGQRIAVEAVAGRHLESDFTDLHFFTALVRRLVGAGVAVAVASFGKYAVIQAYLDRAFEEEAATPGVVGAGASSGADVDMGGESDREAAKGVDGGGGAAPAVGSAAPANAARIFTRLNISTPSAVGGQDGYSMKGGKNVQLAALAAQFRVLPAEVLFFDGEHLRRRGVGWSGHSTA
jgi:hypothetical protein